MTSEGRIGVGTTKNYLRSGDKIQGVSRRKMTVD